MTLTDAKPASHYRPRVSYRAILVWFTGDTEEVLVTGWFEDAYHGSIARVRRTVHLRPVTTWVGGRDEAVTQLVLTTRQESPGLPQVGGGKFRFGVDTGGGR